jgi:hypothetical protein
MPKKKGYRVKKAMKAMKKMDPKSVVREGEMVLAKKKKKPRKR